MSQTNMERSLEAVKAMMEQAPRRPKDPDGEPEGFVTKPSDLEGLSASTMLLTKDLADVLTRAMPGFRWAIQPSEFGKVFNVFCLDFSERWGYRIKFTDVQDDPKRKEALKAGRELLARFRYPGVRYDPKAMASLPRNARGEAIPDVSDLPATRFTKRVDVERALAEGKARVIGTKGHGQIIEVRT